MSLLNKKVKVKGGGRLFANLGERVGAYSGKGAY